MKKGEKFTIFAILIGIFLYLIASIVISYYIIPEKNPLLKEKVKSKDISYLYSFYILSVPEIDNRIYFGHQDADITIIAVIDLTSQDSKYFITELFPQLKEEFIDRLQYLLYLILIDSAVSFCRLP